MKHFKQLCIACAVLALLVTPVSALNLGTWTLSGGDLDDGEFYEQVVDMTIPLVTLNIFAQFPSIQWNLSNFLFTGYADESTSTYAYGTLVLGDEPDLWGESITVSGVDLVKKETPLLYEGVPYGAQADVSTTIFYEDYIISLSGTFVGVLGQNFFTDGQTFYSGIGFDEIVFSISEVPEPGTIALFGIGLLAVAIGRKKLVK